MGHHGGYLLHQSLALLCQLGRKIDCIFDVQIPCHVSIFKVRHALAIHGLDLAGFCHSLLLKRDLPPVQVFNLHTKYSATPPIVGSCPFQPKWLLCGNLFSACKLPDLFGVWQWPNLHYPWNWFMWPRLVDNTPERISGCGVLQAAQVKQSLIACQQRLKGQIDENAKFVPGLQIQPGLALEIWSGSTRDHLFAWRTLSRLLSSEQT